MTASLLPLPALDPGTSILAGFSGGLDSSVLLHRLSEVSAADGVSLRAVHIHHGLSASSDAWAHHCQQFCDSLDIALTIIRVHVALDSGHGPEASARDARYKAFESVLREGEWLALAHHRDDQAETVLLRLLRASASEGLASMQPTRRFASGLIWRPLLDVPRSQLHEYATRHGLRWIDDPSNDELHLDRNFLRHRILPTLQERWPHAGAALARSAALLSEDADLLRAEADKRLAQVQSTEASTLSVAALMGYDAAWRPRILRRWLSTLALPSPPGDAFAIIESQLLLSRPDAEPEYHWTGVVLRRWRDLLHVERKRAGFPDDWQSTWHGDGDFLLPTGDRLRLVSIAMATPAASAGHGIESGATSPTNTPRQGGFIVRARRGGERIQLPDRKHSHALKKMLQQLGVPPWERERLPLVFSADEELLAVGDVLVSARFHEFQMATHQHLAWERA